MSAVIDGAHIEGCHTADNGSSWNLKKVKKVEIKVEKVEIKVKKMKIKVKKMKIKVKKTKKIEDPLSAVIGGALIEGCHTADNGSSQKVEKMKIKVKKMKIKVKKNKKNRGSIVGSNWGCSYRGVSYCRQWILLGT